MRHGVRWLTFVALYTRPPFLVGTRRWTGLGWDGRGYLRIPQYMTRCSTSDRSQPRLMKLKQLRRCFCTQGSASAVVRDSATILYSLPSVQRFHLLLLTHGWCGKSAFVCLCVTWGEHRHGLTRLSPSRRCYRHWVGNADAGLKALLRTRCFPCWCSAPKSGDHLTIIITRRAAKNWKLWTFELFYLSFQSTDEFFVKYLS